MVQTTPMDVLVSNNTQNATAPYPGETPLETAVTIIVGIFISAIGILMFWCYAKYTQPGVPLHNFFGDCPGCYYKAQQAKLEGTAQPEEEED